MGGSSASMSLNYFNDRVTGAEKHCDLVFLLGSSTALLLGTSSILSFAQGGVAGIIGGLTHLIACLGYMYGVYFWNKKVCAHMDRKASNKVFGKESNVERPWEKGMPWGSHEETMS